ncbi:hypothetical protein [Synechococcus sp. UW140]|uniref:hypothetical protein n=1 Tax=Synechococcus sp. UW140 TaxID=368503 RepID=UPI0031379820
MQASQSPTSGEPQAANPLPEEQVQQESDELELHDPDWFDDEAFGGSSSGFAEAPQGW